LNHAGNTLKYRLLRPPLVLLRHRGVSPHDVFLASYPRSGSTWLRFILAHALGHKPDYENIRRMIPPVGRQSQALARLPDGGRLIKTHEPRDFPHGQRCRRAVYLLRDGRDVAVSYYFFMQRNSDFSGSFPDFLSMFLKGRVDGYRPWHLHVRSWLESPLAASGDVLAIRYEDMLRTPDESLARVVEFLGVPADPARLHDAIEAHRFERMRQRSSESPTVKATAVRDDIPIVRKGKAGDWRDHFGTDECALFSKYAGAVLERYGYDPL
jgi:Sulfotransferase domain